MWNDAARTSESDKSIASSRFFGVKYLNASRTEIELFEKQDTHL